MHWIATHAPKPTRREDLPDNNHLKNLWDKLSFYHDNKKIFPLLQHHKFCAKKFGLPALDSFKPGIPPSVLSGFMENLPPHSYIKIYTCLYNISYFHSTWRMRVCEFSVGLISKKTGVSERTVKRYLNQLRISRYVRLIWRGRPDPDKKRYLHSCYELPYSFNHILSWRINNGRKRKNDH
jgi:hypothetical protein